MINRFEGNPRILREAILNQQCVAHDDAIADAICATSELVEIKPGDRLTDQGGHDNDIYLILAGRISIRVNGREMAIRQAGQHVGEMVTINPAATRSATTVALEETIVAKVSEPAFATIAEAHPLLWRRLAKELGDRLRERTKFVKAPNPRPVIFIGSSTEGLTIANEIQAGLSHDDYVLTVWTNNVFIPGHGTMEDLQARITTADFGVLVCTPDDRIINEDRGVDEYGPRDNVILELGMCLGALGQHRTLLVQPRIKELKKLTDMLGITPIDYKADDPDNLTAHIGPVCTAIRKVIEMEGVR
jgi:CRP/FNR family transcriptional regulator, cyclic AMP receptor protein